MSLVGNLEDLGLGDILQIVSLSRKSGILSLKSGANEGKIYFSNGQVIKAWTNGVQENIGELLVGKNLVTPEILKRAISVQKQTTEKKRIGVILTENFKVAREDIEATVREQTEQIIYSFFGWTRGVFDFELGEPEELASTNFNPLQFMLAQGLNPQWLALEGSRLLDEKRHADAAQNHTESNPAGLFFSRKDWIEEERAARGGNDRVIPPDARVIVVDDDPATRLVLCRELNEKGLGAVGFDSGRTLLHALSGWEATTAVFVLDLVMATMDGEGIFGGLELAGKIKSRWPDVRVVLMTDHSDDQARKRANGLQVEEVVHKPSRKTFQEGDQPLAVLEFVDKITRIITQSESDPKEGFFDIGGEIFAEEGAELIEKWPEPSPSESKSAHLRGILEELGSLPPMGGIPLLALRLAAEHFNRAIIFARRAERLVGLGQFGLDAACRDADRMVREIAIPLDQESFFRKTLQEPVPQIAVPTESPLETDLFARLGDGSPVDVFLGPIIQFGEVAYLLYGDNRPAPRPIGDTENLEIFLILAGLALEKESLARELQKRSAV